jgi:integration host factor subunit alpha
MGVWASGTPAWLSIRQMMVALAPSLPTALLELLAAAARAQVVRSDFGAVTAYRFLARESRFERGVVVSFGAHLGMVGGFSKKEAADIVETVFDIAKKTLEKGDKIKISGFGNFVVRDKKARPGRNPQTGHEITISARRVLTFKASLVLNKALNL